MHHPEEVGVSFTLEPRVDNRLLFVIAGVNRGTHIDIRLTVLPIDGTVQFGQQPIRRLGAYPAL